MTSVDIFSQGKLQEHSVISSSYGYIDASNGYSYNDSLAAFIQDRNVKLYWIAFFTLWVYWGLIWFVRHVFGDGHRGPDYAGRDEAVPVNPTTNESATVPSRPWIRRPEIIAAHVSWAANVLITVVNT